MAYFNEENTVEQIAHWLRCAILQCMYLDKPMKNHTLLQAICRTNRTYNENKKCGLIVDFVGVCFG